LTEPNLGIKITGQYYTYTSSLYSSPNLAAYYNATPISTYAGDLKNYGSSVSQDTSGNFTSVICESIGTALSNGSIGAHILASDSCYAGNIVN